MSGKPRIFATPQAWLEYYSMPVTESGCWLFMGATDKRGYGKVGVRSVTTIASRHSWKLFNGPIPDDLCVCHRCDTPLCINPKHLFLGTQSENIKDMMAKGRKTPTVKFQCRHGHDLERTAHGKICRICARAAKRRYRAKLAESSKMDAAALNPAK